MSYYYAWCTRSGSVAVSVERNLPLHAIVLARARSAKKLKELMGVVCRHGCTPGELLVPGMPEAGYVRRSATSVVMVEDPTPEEVAAARLEALNAFGAWLRARAGEGVEIPDHWEFTPAAAWDAPKETASAGGVQAAKEQTSASTKIH